jgi:hypothetical protein
MKKNRNLRIFLASMFGTLCVIALVLGLAKVDYRSRRIGFGDEKTLIYQITGKNPDITCIAGEICYNNSVLS